ncbi:MAG: polyamine aminopropyltransferase [Syntrophomonadaceae bacterium]|jgi:spermidine synthase
MENIWFTESHTEGYEVRWKIKDILHIEKSDYQSIAVLDTVEWGKALVLDGIVQITEADEYVYHEMIVHPSMFTHPQPNDVLIIGGGDGGTLREVAKHKEVQSVDMVEIDLKVIESSKKFFPSVSSSLDDPRLNLYVEDGVEFVKKPPRRYDVVIVDSSDPIGPATQLYSLEFYRNIGKALKDDGILVVQSESPIFYRDLFASIVKNIHAVFANAYVYQAFVPTYVSGPWTFTMGSKRYNPCKLSSDIQMLNGLKYYNESIHRAAFCLPEYIKNLIS